MPQAKPGGRPEKSPKRELLNGIFYILRGGCARRLLPHDFGELIAWVWRPRPWQHIHLEMVKRPEDIKGFLLLPKRWSVERTFAWLV